MKVEFTKIKPKQFLNITIKDTGIGMNKGKL